MKNQVLWTQHSTWVTLNGHTYDLGPHAVRAALEVALKYNVPFVR